MEYLGYSPLYEYQSKFVYPEDLIVHFDSYSFNIILKRILFLGKKSNVIPIELQLAPWHNIHYYIFLHFKK
jgi:hypothetical protein